MAGIDGDGLIVSPPFVITKEEIDRVVDRLYETLKKILST